MAAHAMFWPGAHRLALSGIGGHDHGLRSQWVLARTPPRSDGPPFLTEAEAVGYPSPHRDEMEGA
jgi:hypothetical protein